MAQARQEGNPTAKQNRNQAYFHHVDVAAFQQAPEELPAAEQPDVLATPTAKVFDRLIKVGPDDGYTRVVLRPQRPREDVGGHIG